VYMDSSYRGWILEGIIRESAEAVGQKIAVVWIPNKKVAVFNPRNVASWMWLLLPARSVLFVNQKLFVRMKKRPIIWFVICRRKEISVYFTHESETEEFVCLCNDDCRVSRVTTFNNSDSLNLRMHLRPEIDLRVSYGAVDRSVFYPLGKEVSLNPSFVLIVGIMSPRKNPALIKRAIERNPGVDFVIHGENWELLWTDTHDMPNNLRIIEFDFGLNPQLMRDAACLLTISDLEGGPYPTLEALASGTPVVASRTGWNPELINELNGFLISNLNADHEISAAINGAFELKKANQQLDLLPLEYSWERVARALY